jgi:predicted transcriptional regulator
MATLTIEIDKDRYFPILQEVLNKMGLEFELEDDDWSDFTEAAIEGIKAGMTNIKAGHVHTHAEIMAHMEEKLNHWRLQNG